MAVRIAVDAMGGDNAPDAIVRGALLARGAGVQAILVGDEPRIASLLQNGEADHCEVLHAPATVGMGEEAVRVLRQRRDTSLEVATRLVADGKAEGVVSAGHSGAAVLMANKHLRRPGIRKPVLGTFMPTSSERPAFILDVGGNTDTMPGDLVQFAHLGSEFFAAWSGDQHPRVALLNIGSEPGKGDRRAREAYELLSVADGINFVGNIEGRGVAGGAADVVVCDGFDGNVLLKFGEGMASTVLTLVGREQKALLKGKWWAPFLRGLVSQPLLEVRKKIDYSEYGGAPLLGLSGGFFICHGSSNAKAIANAILKMKGMLDRNLHDPEGV